MVVSGSLLTAKMGWILSHPSYYKYKVRCVDKEWLLYAATSPVLYF